MSLVFTVFTATYNRAHTLQRLCDSLRAQTFTSFEWLIVDDGSTDDTSVLVESMRAGSPFPIRYMYQENAGKHVAFERAVDAAGGELFLPVDSDDALVPHALARLYELWRTIPEDCAPRFAGLTAACQRADGQPIGPPLPRSTLDCSALDAVFRWGVRGERFGFQRTDVLRRIRFPVGAELAFVPEGVLWFKIGRSYLTRFVDEPLRIYYTDEQNRLTTSTSKKKCAGLAYYAGDLLTNYTDYAVVAPMQFLKAAVHYNRFAGLLPPELRPTGRFPIIARLLLLATAAPAALLALFGGEAAGMTLTGRIAGKESERQTCEERTEEREGDA